MRFSFLRVSVLALALVARGAFADGKAYPATAEFTEAMTLVNAGKFEEAIPKLDAAAKQGNADAMVILGRMYIAGNGTSPDAKAGAAQIEKAAELGSADGQFLLGELYARGIGKTSSEEDAYKWYQKAADQGHANAEFKVALCYFQGLGGVKEDRAAGAKWLDKAAQGDDPQVVSAAAQLFDDVRMDEYYNAEKAVQLFKRAAEAGDADAQFYLGQKYRDGEGVEKNLDQAVKLLDAAAGKGHVVAMQHLAKMMLAGEGIAKDPERAYFVAGVAVGLGNEFAKQIQDDAAKELNSEQIQRLNGHVQEEVSKRKPAN